MSVRGSGIRQVIAPTHQADATLNQANPVQNTWYPVLATTKNVTIYAALFAVQVTGEDVELRIVIDGNTLVTGQAALAGTVYTVLPVKTVLTANALISTSGLNEGYMPAFILSGKSVAVAVRKTSAAGAGNLQAKVIYGKW